MTIEVALLDIEGTIGDIAFVRDVLFPFARARIGDHLRDHWHDETVRACVAALSPPAPDPETAADRFRALSDADVKAGPLKVLQGLIWDAGYRSGALRAHLYPDAVETMGAWRARGIALRVYSSGSIAAQRLYFAHSIAGDLTPLLSGHFDTTTGPKTDPASYRAIAAEIGVAPSAILFLTDNIAEARAAREAGVAARLIDRALGPGAEGVREGFAVSGALAARMIP